jgi:hypothetical protein
MLAGILRHFLTLDTSVGVTAPPQAKTTAVLSNSDHEGVDEGGGGGEDEEAEKSPLEVRMALLECYIEQLPRNVEDRRKLMDHGYSGRLWDQVCASGSWYGPTKLDIDCLVLWQSEIS